MSVGWEGFDDASASAAMIFSMLVKTRLRVSGRAARTLSLRFASSGMIFSASPAWIAETVTWGISGCSI